MTKFLIAFLLFTGVAYAQDSTEVLELKKALYTERLQARYRDVQELQKALKDIDAELEKRKPKEVEKK